MSLLPAPQEEHLGLLVNFPGYETRGKREGNAQKPPATEHQDKGSDSITILNYTLCITFYTFQSMFISFAVQFSSVTQSRPTVCNPMDYIARQTSLSITNSRSLLKLMSIESVMPSNHLILCRPLLLLPSIFASIRVFSSESVLHIRWPKYWSCSFSISLSV